MFSYFVVQSLWTVAMFFRISSEIKMNRSFTAQSFQTSQEKPETTGQCLRFFLRIIFGKLNSFVA